MAVPLRFGVHTGPQHCSMAELQALWRVADEKGFDWISVWDHLYPAVIGESRGDCFEGVASMTALAAATRNVTVGCLVFCVLYRNPGVLAKAMVTVDHVSGGRMEIGLGIGWHQTEADAFGLPFPSLRERLDRLAESAEILRRLWREDAVTFDGRYYKLDRARCEPKPMHAWPRVWIGGTGERRLLRIVAQHADGWNAPFLAPEAFAQKNAVLDQWCERERRDPADILRSINVGLAIAADERDVPRLRAGLAEQFGAMLPLVEPGILVGTPDQIAERVAAYRDAGVQRLVLALRAPFDVDGVALFRERVMPRFQ
jgi:F420-dependent oxidoreductase-like protein